MMPSISYFTTPTRWLFGCRVGVCIFFMIVLSTNFTGECTAQTCQLGTIQIDRNTGATSKNVIPILGTRTLIQFRNFRFLVMDPKGYLDDTSVEDGRPRGEQRKDILMLLLEDFWYTLNPKINSDTAFLDIDLIIQEFDSQETRSVAGWAEPVQFINTADKFSVIEPLALTVVRTGIDPLLLIKDAPNFHGRITLNTAFDFDAREKLCRPDAVSLYAVMFHEMLHIFGVASDIGHQCLLSGRSDVAVVSRWDAMLRTEPNNKLVSISKQGGEAVFPSGYIGAYGVRIDVEDGNQIARIHAFDEPSNCLRDLSHVANLPGYPSYMTREMPKGQAFIIPSYTDMRLLSLLGYQVSSVYGSPKRDFRFPTGIELNSSVSITVIDSLRLVIGTVRTIPLSDLAKNDVGRMSGAYSVTAASTDFYCVVDSTGDSLIMDARLAQPTRALATQLWQSDSSQPGTQFLSINIVDTAYIETEKCPPNTVCNGGFELNTRYGSIETLPNCQEGGPIAYWSTCIASPDLYPRRGTFKVNTQIYQGDVLGFPKGDNFGSSPDAVFADVMQNDYYLGMIGDSYLSDGSVHTGDDFPVTEGVSQVIEIENDMSQNLFVVQCYANASIYSRAESDYLQSAALRIMVVDTSVCDWRSCKGVHKAILDTVIRLQNKRKWTLLRTAPLFIPNGKYRLRITTTPCYRPIPYYGQGSESYILLDEVSLVRTRGMLQSIQFPLYPCKGEPARIGIQITHGAVFPDKIESRILWHHEAVQLSANPQVSIADSTSNYISRIWYVVGYEKNLDFQPAVEIEVSQFFGTDIVKDTVKIPINVGESAITAAITNLQASSNELKGTIKLVNKLTTPQLVSGILHVEGGFQAMPIISLDAKVLDSTALSNATINTRSLFIPIDELLLGNKTQFVEFSIRSSDGLNITSNPTVHFKASSVSSTCVVNSSARISNGIKIVPASIVRSLRPNPTSSSIDVDLYTSTGNGMTLKIVDVLGREVSEQQLNLRYSDTQKLYTVSLDVSTLSAGYYQICISNGIMFECQPFIKVP